MPRPTQDILLNTADWNVVELNSDETSGSLNLFPRIWARLAKPWSNKEDNDFEDTASNPHWKPK
jgi:cell division septal protein FtsQ